jgi:hypothetical protein
MGTRGWGVKLTTHLHLVPKSKNEWSCISTPLICLHGMVLSSSTVDGVNGNVNSIDEIFIWIESFVWLIAPVQL